MTHRNSARSCWLWGAGITALLWGFLLCFSDIYFAANDDQFILRAMTGFQPGGAPDFHLYLHGMYVYPLRWLQRVFPGIAWFSLLEIALLSLAMTVLLKSLLQCWLRSGRSLRTGLMLSAAFALLYGLHRLDAFPMDVWMKRAMARYLPGCAPKDLGPCAGAVQQVLFHYIRMEEGAAGTP